MAYVDLNDIIVANVIVAPDTGQDSIAFEYLAWMHKKAFQKFKLTRSQVYRALFTGYYARGPMERDTLKGEDIPDGFATPSQNCTHAGHQLLEDKWLGNVIVRPNIQPGNTILNVFFRCQ